jgi:hypothetical protein
MAVGPKSVIWFWGAYPPSDRAKLRRELSWPFWETAWLRPLGYVSPAVTTVAPWFS